MNTNNTQTDRELTIIDSLLKDAAFAEAMAKTLDASYYEGIGQTPPPFLNPEEETATANKPLRDEKVAINLAGFYALECGVSYLAMQRNLAPSAILKSLLDGSLSNENQLLFACFANATWKAGQPFRGMERITRDVFTPFLFLSEADKEKDLVQVKAAARKVLPLLEQ